MRIVLGDITKMDTDAIVNTAVSDLSPCPGICSAIFAAADTEELKKACRKIGRCRIGHAMVTPSCGLPSKIIIHVAALAGMAASSGSECSWRNATAGRCRKLCSTIAGLWQFH